MTDTIPVPRETLRAIVQAIESAVDAWGQAEFPSQKVNDTIGEVLALLASPPPAVEPVAAITQRIEFLAYEAALPHMLVAGKAGKWVLIEGIRMQQFFDEYEHALAWGYEKYGFESFFVKKVEAPTTSWAQHDEGIKSVILGFRATELGSPPPAAQPSSEMDDLQIDQIVSNSEGKWAEDVFHVEGPALANMLRAAFDLGAMNGANSNG